MPSLSTNQRSVILPFIDKFTNDIDVSCIDGILINDFLYHLLSLIAWDYLNYTYDVDYAIDTFRVHFWIYKTSVFQRRNAKKEI